MRPDEVWEPFEQGQTPPSRPNYDNHISPWLDASVNQRGNEVPHHSRNFIEGLFTSRDEGTMTNWDRDNSAQDEEVQNDTRNDVTQNDDAEFNERSNYKQ